MGTVAPKTPFEIRPDANPDRYFPLLTLPLVNPVNYHSTSSFLGNLAPMMCTVQSCHGRAKGRLWNLAAGITLERKVGTLHHKDVEWLVSNWLMQRGGPCRVVYSGGASDEAVDHKGWDETGCIVQAQTTVSGGVQPKGAIEDKVDALLDLEGHKFLFAPESVLENSCTELRGRLERELTFVSLERVFAEMDLTAAGRSMITSMLTAREVDPAEVEKERQRGGWGSAITPEGSAGGGSAGRQSHAVRR